MPLASMTAGANATTVLENFPHSGEYIEHVGCMCRSLYVGIK